MASICYSPLNPAHKQIRLLYLLGGASTETIRGELNIVSLDDNLVYEVST